MFEITMDRGDLDGGMTGERKHCTGKEQIGGTNGFDETEEETQEDGSIVKEESCVHFK